MRKSTSPVVLVLWIAIGLLMTYGVLRPHARQAHFVPLAMAMPAMQAAEPAAPEPPEVPDPPTMAVALPGIPAIPEIPALPAMVVGAMGDTCSDHEINFGDDMNTFRGEEHSTMAAPAALEIESAKNGPLSVRGADRNDIAITLCKAVAAESDTEARTLLSQIKVVTEGGRISVTGPADSHWAAALIVTVPRAQALSATGTNGPMKLDSLTGKVNVMVRNGPLQMDRITGQLHAEARNGPVQLKHGSGTVEIDAHNGPLAIELSGERWNGTLTASTHNGPLQVRLPKGFASGVEVDSGSGPFACNLDSCGELRRSRPGEGQHVKIGGDPVVVHLRADHGPVAIGSAMD